MKESKRRQKLEMEETKTLRLLKGGLRRREADEESCWFRDFFFFSLSPRKRRRRNEKKKKKKKKRFSSEAKVGPSRRQGPRDIGVRALPPEMHPTCCIMTL